MMLFFFFFQAEDGIRDVAVTGVQTCALPICSGQASGENKETECAVDTVYFGGGTPSLLETRQLEDILEAIRETSGTNGSRSVEVEGGFAPPWGPESNRDSVRPRREEGGPPASHHNELGKRSGEEQAGV